MNRSTETASTRSKRLDLIGLPFAGPSEVTEEVRLLIQEAEVVASFFAVSWHEDFVKSVSQNVIDLRSIYSEGQSRSQMYARIVARVASLFQAHYRVAYVAYGSPMVLDDISASLLQWAHKESIEWNVPTVPSFVDFILAKAGISIGGQGLQLLEASALLLRPELLNKHVPLLLAQIGLIDNDTSTYDAPARDAGQALAAILESAYGSAASAVLCDFDQVSFTGVATRLQLRDLAELVAYCSPAASLYVGPILGDS